MKSFLFLIFSTLLSFSTFAEDKGYTGFTLDVTVEGFFSPELKNIVVKEVKPDSPAEKGGIKVGDQLVSIDGCEIPGCPAKKGKKLITRPAGEQLPLTLQRPDGEKYSVELLLE